MPFLPRSPRPAIAPVRRLPAAVAVLALAASATALSAEAPGKAATGKTAVTAAVTAGPAASDAWIAEAPSGAAHNAAYLTLRNGPRADVLEAVESPVCAVAELHAMQRSRGVLRMRPEPRLALAPGATVAMAPGGRHIMLIDMKRTLTVGEKVPLTLRFRKAGVITVLAEVRSRVVDSAPAPGDHAHHHH